MDCILHARSNAPVLAGIYRVRATLPAGENRLAVFDFMQKLPDEMLEQLLRRVEERKHLPFKERQAIWNKELGDALRIYGVESALCDASPKLSDASPQLSLW